MEATMAQTAFGRLARIVAVELAPRVSGVKVGEDGIAVKSY